MALASSLAAIADFGLYDFTVRELNNPHRNRKHFLTLVAVLRLMLSLLSFLVLVVLSLSLAGADGRSSVLFAVGSQQILLAFATGAAAVLAARDDMAFPAIIEALCRLAGMGLAILLSLTGWPLALALVGPVLSTFGQIIVVLLRIRHQESKSQDRDGGDAALSFMELWRTVRSAFPYLLSDLARRLSIRIDLIMLGFLVSAALTGLYAAGQRVVAVLLFVPHFAALALLPMMSRLSHERADELAALATKSFRIGVLLGVPGTLGLILIAPEITVLLYGAAFAEASLVLSLIAPLFLIECLRNPLGNLLTATGQQSFRTRAEWEALALAIPLQLVGIVLIGAEGAAVAIVLSELFLLVRFALRTRSLFNVKEGFSALWPACSGCVIMSVPVIAWQPGLALTLSYCLLVYPIVIITFRQVRRHEWSALQTFYGSLKGHR